MSSWQEIWHGLRPYAVRSIIDFSVSSALWVALFAFKALTDLLEVNGWASGVIVWLHSVGSAGCFLFLAQGLMRDFCQIQAGQEGG